MKTDAYYYMLGDLTESGDLKNKRGPTIIIRDKPGPFNEWKCEPLDCLVQSSGSVESKDGNLICNGTDNTTIVVLNGASWTSTVGSHGEVSKVLGDKCSPTGWKLLDIVSED